MDTEHKARLKAQHELAARIQDLIDADPAQTAIQLMDLTVAILAKEYPATLNATAKQKIKENYPDATPALMAERSMNEEGLLMALATASMLASIAIDYSPVTHIKPLMDRDFALPEVVPQQFIQSLQIAFSGAEQMGMSAFGAATTMVLLAVVTAQERGVPGIKLARPVIDALNRVFDKPAQPSMKEMEEQVIKSLQARLGVSRATAKRYVAQAKKDLGEEL